VVNTINVGSLPPVITYTITGTDSAFGMSSCNNKVFYLTILTCNGAESSDACVGDTIFFNAPGDSIAATYRWYGPAPSTAVFAVTQSTYKYPATMADAGLYKVIKTVAGIPDTSETTVAVFALPVLAVTSTQANCKPVVNPLNLYCNPDSVCTDFDWTGPVGFTSTMQNPMIAPFDSSMAGYYVVEATSTHGCKNKDSVEVKPGPWAKYLFDRMPGCPNDTVIFTDYSWNGSTYEWTFGDGFTSFDRNPLHLYTAGHKQYSVKLTVRSANGCTDDTTMTVDVSHGVTADFSFADDTICNITEQGIIIDASTSFDVTTPGQPIAAWDWDLGDGTTESNATGAPANHTYPFEGPFTVRLKVTDALGCVDSTKKEILVLQPYIRALSDTTFCLTQPLQLFADAYTNKPGIEGLDDYSYAWTGAGIGNLSATTGNTPTFTGVGVFVYTITATLAGEGCQGTHQMTLNSTLPKQLTQVTKDVTILYGSSIQLNSDSEFLYTWTPNDGSLDNPNINNPIATPTVTTTYTVYGMDFYGCRDTAWITVRVDSSKTEFIPTAFTPNGDGLNDEFRLIGSAFHNMLEFRIYNRWGEQIFYSTTLDHGWDGTYQGQKMDMGVYYYTVICARPGHPTNKVIKGEVTLIR
jgi:gliding motility-associated-like protein